MEPEVFSITTYGDKACVGKLMKQCVSLAMSHFSDAIKVSCFDLLATSTLTRCNAHAACRSLHLCSLGAGNVSLRASKVMHEALAYFPKVEQHLQQELHAHGMTVAPAKFAELRLEWEQAVWSVILFECKKHSDPACSVRLTLC